MLASAGFGLLLLAAALAAGFLLTPSRLLTAVIALLPAVAWIDTLRWGHPAASVIVTAALLGAALLRGVRDGGAKSAADPRGARGWWWAFGLYALGQALALFWLLPFSGNGAAFSALAGFLPGLFGANANQFEFGLSAAVQLLCIPAAATAAALLLRGTEPAALARAVRRGFQGALLLGCGFAAAGLAGWGGGTLMKGYRFNSGLPDPNSAGTFYLVACAALLATGMRATIARQLDRHEPWIERGWLLLGLLLLLATGSRVALFALPLVVAGHLLQRGMPLKKILRLAPVAAAAGFALLYLGYRLDQRQLIPFIHPGSLTHLYQVITPDYLAAQGFAFRGAYWRAASRAWLDSPLSGVGIGRLYGAMARYMEGSPWPVQFYHENAHNQWLQWLAELGLIGFLLAGAAQLQSWRVAGPHARLMLLAFALTALTGHPLLVPVMPLLLGLLLGLPGAGPAARPGAAIPDAPALWRRYLPLAALPLGLLAARPRFTFAGHVRGDGAPLPEKSARWSMSCPLWSRIHPVEAAAPERLADPAARRGAITLLEAPPVHPAPGGSFILPVRLNNLSTRTWPAQRDCSGHIEYVHLAYHWRPRAGITAGPIEGDRTMLTADLPPGQTTDVELAVRAPPDPENYELVPDALQEGVAWFELPVTGQ